MTVFKYSIHFAMMYSRALLFTLFAFTSVTAAQEGSTAELTIEGISNSSSIGSKSFTVTKYADEACSKLGKTHKVFKKKYAKNVHTFKPLTVDVSQPFVFQVAYLEERRSEIKRCASIANVDLKENGRYKAVFSIVDEVIGCDIKIYDLDYVAGTETSDLALPSSTTEEIAASDEGAQVVAEVDETNTPQEDALEVTSVASSPSEIEYKKPAETCTKVGKMGYRNGTPVYTYKDRFG
jgi:hypothetical protein